MRWEFLLHAEQVGTNTQECAQGCARISKDNIWKAEFMNNIFIKTYDATKVHSFENLPLSKAKRKNAGFTLVEMAVVLVVIGVILSSVMIGRDVQRNSEYVKIRQTFINQWAVAYNTYVQRLGVPPGDDVALPRVMVDGANYHSSNGSVSGGDMTSVTAPNAICQGTAGPKMLRPIESTTGFQLRDLMLAAGVELPAGRGQGSEDRYVYRDSNGNPQELQVCFQWNPPGTASGSGNVMVITGLTPDLARALAVGVKGTADASTGTFRQEGVTTGAGSAQGIDWTSSNADSYTTSETGATLAVSREAQVQTVVANYKMNQ